MFGGFQSEELLSPGQEAGKLYDLLACAWMQPELLNVAPRGSYGFLICNFQVTSQVLLDFCTYTLTCLLQSRVAQVLIFLAEFQGAF